MSNVKKQSILLITVVCCATLALISIAFSAFSSTLKLSGQANVAAQSWDIDFTNTVGTKWTTAQSLTGTTTNLAELPTSSSGAFGLPVDQTASGFLGSLRMSGDKITYTWYVQNFGTFEAKYSVTGLIKTDKYFSGSNVDISCNTSDNSSDKTFCNNYVKTTLTIDGVVASPTDSYTLAKAGETGDSSTLVLTIEIIGDNQIYTATAGAFENRYSNTNPSMLSSGIEMLDNSNDLNISVTGLTLTGTQSVAETSPVTETITSSYNKYINKSYTYSYTGSSQEFEVEYPGYYKVELWGASGGSDSGYYFSSGEKAYGGYTSGQIYLDKGTKLYLYVGQEAQTYQYQSDGTFNGGGAVTTISSSKDSTCGGQGTTGGGATDIRLVSGDWNNSISLASRIMVAGGAGGIGGFGTGGNAGGLNSYSGSFTSGAISGGHRRSTQSAASQTAGGIPDTSSTSYVSSGLANTSGSFGQGGRGAGAACMGAGGGGGYYGGAGSYNMGAGSGGSSYISGHVGSVAISSESSLTPRNDSNGNQCSDGTTDITCSYHYSGLSFTNTSIVDGLGYSWTSTKGSQSGMPTHDGTSTMTGNSGDGYAKITYLGESI